MKETKKVTKKTGDITKKKSVRENKKATTAKKIKTSKTSKNKKVVTRKVKKNSNKKATGMKDSSFGYLLAAIFELVMAIPVLGWWIGFSSLGCMWVIGAILHIVIMVILIKRKRPIYGNIIGAVANVFGAIPIFGWFLHVIAMILLFILFFREDEKI